MAIDRHISYIDLDLDIYIYIIYIYLFVDTGSFAISPQTLPLSCIPSQDLWHGELTVRYAGCIYLPHACELLQSDPNSQLAQGIKYSQRHDIQEGLRREDIASHDLVVVLEMSASPLLRLLSQQVSMLLIFGASTSLLLLRPFRGVYPLTQSREMGLEIPKEVEMNLRHPRSYIAAREIDVTCIRRVHRLYTLVSRHSIRDHLRFVEHISYMHAHSNCLKSTWCRHRPGLR